MWDLSRQHTGLSLAVRRGFQSAGSVVAIYDLIASQLVGSHFPDQKSPALEGGLLTPGPPESMHLLSHTDWGCTAPDTQTLKEAEL